MCAFMYVQIHRLIRHKEGMCSVCGHVCTQARIPTKGPEENFMYPGLPCSSYCLETGSFTEPGARPGASKSQ